eukprot:5274941-Pyramimonas_sp.AAC.1
MGVVTQLAGSVSDGKGVTQLTGSVSDGKGVTQLTGSVSDGEGVTQLTGSVAYPCRQRFTGVQTLTRSHRNTNGGRHQQVWPPPSQVSEHPILDVIVRDANPPPAFCRHLALEPRTPKVEPPPRSVKVRSDSMGDCI